MPPRKRFRPLVLVIDESRDARLTVRFYLYNEGYEVAEAASGQSAFESVASDLPDLVLVDLNMPGPSGVLRKWFLTERLFKRLLTTRISTFEKTYGFFSCFLSIFPRSFLGSDSTNSTRRGYL